MNSDYAIFCLRFIDALSQRFPTGGPGTACPLPPPPEDILCGPRAEIRKNIRNSMTLHFYHVALQKQKLGTPALSNKPVAQLVYCGRPLLSLWRHFVSSVTIAMKN